MPIASFQNKVFTVSSTKKYPIIGLNWGGSLETEAQDKLKDKPSTYIKGEMLDNMSFEIPLRADFGINPRKQIEEWESIKSKAQPSLFILGTKPVGKNKWLLKSTSVSEQEIDGIGRIIKATIKLEFEEYVRAGKAKPTNSSNVAIGTSESTLVPSQYIFDPPDKSIAKRNNPNLPYSYI
jgi:hypothetical protein